MRKPLLRLGFNLGTLWVKRLKGSLSNETPYEPRFNGAGLRLYHLSVTAPSGTGFQSHIK